MADSRTNAENTAATDAEAQTFTEEERAAMRERAKEQRRSRRASKADGERDVLEKIAEMDEPDRSMAERVVV